MRTLFGVKTILVMVRIDRNWWNIIIDLKYYFTFILLFFSLV